MLPAGNVESGGADCRKDGAMHRVAGEQIWNSDQECHQTPSLVEPAWRDLMDCPTE